MRLTILTASGKVRDAAVSPDGKYLAYVTADAGMRSLWVRQIATSSAVQVIPPSDASYGGLTFSLDGNYIYYVGEERKGTLIFGTLYEMPVLGGAAKKLVFDVDSPVAISPDGKQLAFVRTSQDQQETSLMVANGDGSAERKLATRKSPAKFETGGPAWSPDGRRIALGAMGSGFSVVVVNVPDGKEQTFASEEWGTVGRVAWLPDGSGVLVVAFGEGDVSQIWHLTYPNGQPRRITNDTNDYGGLSVTADGKTLVTVSAKSSTRLWTVPQGEWSRAREINPGTSEKDGSWGFSWMPDGRILYTSGSNLAWTLWVMNRDGSNPREFPVGVPLGSVGLGVSACSDGRYILFESHGTARVDSEGGNLKHLTIGDDQFDHLPRCSSDGQWVVYLTTRAGLDALWKLPIEGGTPVKLREKPTFAFALSRDGKWIACMGSDYLNQPWDLIVLPIQGGPPSKVLHAPRGAGFVAVDWAPDGRSLTFSARQKGVGNVWTQPLTGGPPKQLTNFETGDIFSLAWSLDGKQLALVRRMGTSDAIMISNFIGSER